MITVVFTLYQDIFATKNKNTKIFLIMFIALIVQIREQTISNDTFSSQEESHIKYWVVIRY